MKRARYIVGRETIHESPTDRAARYRAFEERFRKPWDCPAPAAPTPIDEAIIKSAEHELGCLFPVSYITFVTEIGPCVVRGLSDAWLLTEHSDCPMPFENLWPPSDAVNQYQHPWLAPIPSEVTGGASISSDVAWKHLLPFASDGGGNWHCFARRESRLDDLPVFYLDHDGGAIDQIAEGFDDLIRKYMLLPVQLEPRKCKPRGTASPQLIGGVKSRREVEMELKVGDWVTSYSPGIWRIYRILTYKGRHPGRGHEQESTVVFAKRFVSNSFRASFKEEVCSTDFVKKLDSEQVARLEEFINENEALYNEFIDYKPEPIGCIYNARIGTPIGKSAKEVEDMISTDRMLNGLEIEAYLEDLGFNTEELPSWTAQFFSPDHTCDKGRLVFKFVRVLEF